MKLKFYLRGIGLGIIVAVALCISAGMKNDQISDEEIIKRAEALGMVPSSETLDESVDEAIRDGLETEEMTENDASGDAAAVKVNEDIPATEPDETEVNPDEADNSNFDETPPAAGSDGTATPKVTPTLTKEATPALTKEVTPAPTKEPDKDTNDTENDTEYITVVVERGSGSDTVARKIEAAGLVANASEFDRYLCNNGYDKRISAGNHKIPINAREEEIAKILCNMQ